MSNFVFTTIGFDALHAFWQAFGDDAVADVFANIAEGARHKWMQLADDSLLSTKADYTNAIAIEELDKLKAVISLTGVLPNLVENGQEAFALHATMLGDNVPVAPKGQPGKRQSADGGFYRNIPFRHTTPGAGYTSGAPMGSAFKTLLGPQEAYNLGKAIHAQAKKLEPTLTAPGQPTQWGGRLPEGLAPKLKAFHSTDIYAGMVKQRKVYEKASQNQYTSWRRIAVGPNGEAVPSVDVHGKPTTPDQNVKWLHPGITARHFAEQTADFVEEISEKAFTTYVDGLVGGP